MILTSKPEKKDPKKGMNDLCSRKLLGYAESFRELARSFDEKFESTTRDRQELLEQRRSWENGQVIHDNLSEMAHIMTKVAKEGFQYIPMETKLQKVIVRMMREEGIFAENLHYIPCENGQLIVAMNLWTVRKGGKIAAHVADMLSVLLQKQMQVSVVSPYLIERRNQSFVFVEEAKYIALTGFAKAIRENEVISGDNYAFLESERGKLNLLLSDGTGSGEKAGKDSGKVLDLMDKMLEAGYDVSAAVSLINAALYARGEDGNHPTLDMCCVDLHLGKCDFYKVGGAVSFLKRGKTVEAIEVGNLPLGIFQKIQIETMSRDLQDGDYLIMISDGVRDAFGEEDYLDTMTYLLEDIAEQNPGEIAEKILHLAIRACGGRIGDDMTVLVAGIWENSGIT